MIVIMGGVFSWATAAAALEGGWLKTLHDLEHQIERSDEEAQQSKARARAFDEHLEMTLTDADTARRATEVLRRDVSADIARWDRSNRQAERAIWMESPREGRAIKRALENSRAPASTSWRSRVELLAEVADGVEHAGYLLTRRGQLDVQFAQFRGQVEKERAERDWILQRVSDGEGKEEIEEELEETAEELEAGLESLERNPTTEDFHRRKGALLPPVSSSPDQLFGPRKQDGSMSYIRHTGLTYLIDEGTDVRSVAPGLVVHAAGMVGYGQMVIIDHGGGYHSIYAHLQSMSVEVDDEVGARRVIGESGQSGSLEGPKLYFELRHRGMPVDPVEWFVR